MTTNFYSCTGKRAMSRMETMLKGKYVLLFIAMHIFAVHKKSRLYFFTFPSYLSNFFIIIKIFSGMIKFIKLSLVLGFFANITPLFLSFLWDDYLLVSSAAPGNSFCTIIDGECAVLNTRGEDKTTACRSSDPSCYRRDHR